MQLPVQGTLQTFIPIQTFREQFNLPATFGINALQPKTWDDLGSIERAGADLNQVRMNMINTLPDQVESGMWLQIVPELAAKFEAELYNINERVGLKEEEIAFAVNGLGDVCNAVAFAIVRARILNNPVPTFDQIYQEWLFNTVQVTGAYYDYEHQGEKWVIRVIIHAYGRIGLEIRTPTMVYYVVDKSLACPAEGYMVNLLRQLAERMIAVTR